MCKCCKCENSRIVSFTAVLWDCSKTYNGATPFSVVAVLDKDYQIKTPKECAESGRGAFNSIGYVQNFYMRELADYEQMYIERSETVPKIASTYALLLVYNDTN